VNKSPGGIWTTQYLDNSVPPGAYVDAKAIVSESGEFYFAGVNQSTGCANVGFGQLTVNGGSVTGTLNTAVVTFTTIPGVNATCAFPDGSTFGTGTVSGTVTERTTLALTINQTTSSNTNLPAITGTWNYSNLYASGSSLTQIAGNYLDGTNTLTVSSGGTIFEQDPTSGCVINGDASILDSAYDAYGMRFTFSSCTGTALILNGQSANGLAALDTTVTPNQLLIGISLDVNGRLFAIAGYITRQ